MTNENQYKSGFVTMVGRPNVGKSTLLNQIFKQKIAAVSPRPQTTRRRQLGIYTIENAQIIFIDTPGIHKTSDKLDEFMNETALETLEDADVIIWIVDASVSPTQEDKICAEKLVAVNENRVIFLVLNKTDLISYETLENRSQIYHNLLPQAQVFTIASLSGLGIDELIEATITALPEGPQYYDEEQITDLYEREIAADFIREAALLFLNEEVPHRIAVIIDDYKERGEDKAYIAATIYVERESQKGIVIGRKGSMLKKIGSAARKQIEEMTMRKVFLDIRVKLNKNWRNKPEALQLMGYIKQ